MRGHGIPVFLLIIFPILASAFVLAHLVNPDPALEMNGLGAGVGGSFLPAGAPGWLDPTIGSLTQPFGALSARDWLHGIAPWWNPYTGIGMPLAAEMQSLSFFLPFVLLFKFHQGWVFFKIALQILSGLSMYALLTELRCHRIAALVPALSLAWTNYIHQHLDPYADEVMFNGNQPRPATLDPMGFPDQMAELQTRARSHLKRSCSRA